MIYSRDLDAPGTFTTNATPMKYFQMGERRRVQARWEVFNIFNRPNFRIPNRNYNETSAGIISDVADSGRGGPRVMQFALKYIPMWNDQPRPASRIEGVTDSQNLHLVK